MSFTAISNACRIAKTQLFIVIMATYSMSGHSLEFQNNYTEIVVKDSTATTVATFDLETANNSVSVSVSGTNYVIENASDFATPTHKWDVEGTDTANFTGAKLGGIVIIDVRDINRTGSWLEEGDYEFSYDLELPPVKLKYASGSFALKVYFEEAECFSIKAS